MMKAMMLTGIRQMKMKDVPGPVIKNDNDVLLKIEYVDVELYNLKKDLAEQKPQKTSQLLKTFRNWKKRTNVPISTKLNMTQ